MVVIIYHLFIGMSIRGVISVLLLEKWKRMLNNYDAKRFNSREFAFL